MLTKWKSKQGDSRAFHSNTIYAVWESLALAWGISELLLFLCTITLCNPHVVLFRAAVLYKMGGRTVELPFDVYAKCRDMAGGSG